MADPTAPVGTVENPFNIGDSDEKADWIKMVDNGKARQRDLAAMDALDRYLAKIRANKARRQGRQKGNGR